MRLKKGSFPYFTDKTIVSEIKAFAVVYKKKTKFFYIVSSVCAIPTFTRTSDDDPRRDPNKLD
jgi:hypothetical protein